MKHENDVSNVIDCGSELWEFTVRASYIVFLFVKTENNNSIKEIKTCCPCLHSLLKTSAKFLRILEQVKTLDCVSGFHWSALEFSQTFAAIFTRTWRGGKHVLFLKWSRKMMWAIWLAISKLWEFTVLCEEIKVYVLASYIVFLFVKKKNTNFINEIKQFSVPS